jgi:hypothetical protein
MSRQSGNAHGAQRTLPGIADYAATITRTAGIHRAYRNDTVEGAQTMRQYMMRAAMLSGLLGTLAQTMVVYGIAPVFIEQSVDLGGLLRHACPLGLLSRLVSGAVLFPLGYLCLPSSLCPDAPVRQGILWAVFLWGMAEGLLAPMLGVGVFSATLGGLPAAGRALLGYLAYGATLGSVLHYCVGADGSSVRPIAPLRWGWSASRSAWRIGIRRHSEAVGPS